MKQTRVVGSAMLGVFVTMFSFSLHAALPDAGTIQRDIGDKLLEVPKASQNPPLSPAESRPPTEAEKGYKVTVRRFVIKGASLFSEGVLGQELSGYVGREATLADLNNAAKRITSYYARQGYLAEALVPAQDIVDGVVVIQVIEARLGSVRVAASEDVRFSRQRASDMVTGAQPSGEYIRIRDLERGLYLLQDTYGIRSSAVIRPGSGFGNVDAMITLASAPLVTGSVEFDNYGSVSTGELRANATVNINSPLNIGDRLSLKALYSDGINYGRALYTIPLGTHGLKAGVSVSYLDYRLGGDFASLDATGSALTAGGFVSMPLILSRRSNLYGIIGYDYRLFRDDIASDLVSEKSIHSGSIGLAGGWFDDMLGGGYTTAGATVSLGSLDLSRVSDVEALDRISANTSGSYQKINMSLSRIQQLSGSSTRFIVSIAGQLASKNLDVSEKFMLGGPNGVRAYSTNEGAGDEGFVVTAELRQSVTSALQLLAFYDYGMIRQYVDTWPGWTTDPGKSNIYSLDGIGIGILLSPMKGLSIKSSVATRLKTNPAANADGKDHDGTKREPRFWVEASYAF
ncbi:MAG: ShlB/FhaC/HecB family hemolysin secretion/activation protein [Chlorobiaceae bacterium]|nr:ShlB/FhaC/HecB family hemolysin secretion/activation protein [Chlorobiaceae bacterium]